MTAPAPLSRDDLDLVADGGTVRLRRKRREDLLEDFDWRKDPETARFDGNPPVTMSLAEYIRRTEGEIQFPSNDRRVYSLVTPEDGLHIGNIMYYNISANREQAEIGISIGLEAARGQGIGAAATVAFLRFLWETTPFRLIFLHTLVWNERAQRCFRRAGFEEVGRLLRNEEWYVRMEVRREWWLLWDGEGRFASERREPANRR